MIADFSLWLKQKHIEVQALDSDVVDRFLRYRCRPHRVRRGDPKALQRLLTMLREQGVVKHQPPVAETAQSRIVAEFRRYLSQERGLSPSTLLNYVSVAEQFLAERFHHRAQNFAVLRAPHATGFVMRHAHQLSPVRAVLLVTALRSFFRYLRHCRRNHAILLLLARLGVRAGEVVGLSLDDIDWSTGRSFTKHDRIACPVICRTLYYEQI